MTLIVIYLLSTVLIFVKIEPFTTVGAFLSICYLPGLCIPALAGKDKLTFEDLLLAFPFSIGISSMLVIVLLYAGVHIASVPVVIHVIAGAAVMLHMLVCYRKKTYPVLEISRHQLMFCSFALLLTLLLSIPFFLGPNRIAISAHAFHHSLLVSQIINGVFPPENPGLGGTIIGYYWGFHALIAAITLKAGLQQIQTIFILNTLSLYLIFCISYCIARVLNISRPYRYILPLAIIGLMRVDAGIIFIVKLFSGELMPIGQLTASPIEPYEVLSRWTSGLSWVDSRLFTLHKLYNVSGMLLALSLCYSYLLILVRNGPKITRVDLAGIALIISACVFNYPPLAIFLLFHLPLWSVYLFMSTDGPIKEKIGQAFRVVVPYIVAGLIVAPYMLYIIASRKISSSGQGGIFSLDFYDQSFKNMIVFLVPLPMIVYGAWVALRRLSLSREFYFLAIGTALCLFLTMFTRWPFNNSYKYNYVLALFFSLFFTFGLSGLFAVITRKWLKQLVAILFVALLLLSSIVVESSHIVSSFSTDHIYSFSEGHLIYAQDKIKNEAYAWIRDNTPANALVMLSYTRTNWPCCGLNNNYEPAAIMERTLYSIEDADYTVSNPEYARRLLFREKLFDGPEDRSVIDYFSGIDRDIFLLVEDRLDEEKFFVEDRFKPFPGDPGGHFALVFQNSRQRIYQLLK